MTPAPPKSGTALVVLVVAMMLLYLGIAVFLLVTDTEPRATWEVQP